MVEVLNLRIALRGCFFQGLCLCHWICIWHRFLRHWQSTSTNLVKVKISGLAHCLCLCVCICHWLGFCLSVCLQLSFWWSLSERSQVWRVALWHPKLKGFSLSQWLSDWVIRSPIDQSDSTLDKVKNKLAKLGDSTAISKSETVTHSLTDPLTEVVTGRCYRI